MLNQIKVQKGSILVYRTFDIGEEINLASVESILSDKNISKGRSVLNRNPKKSIVVKESPLELHLGETLLSIDSNPYKAKLSAKIWNYGSVSFQFLLEIPKNTAWGDLVRLASLIDNCVDIDTIAREKAEQISKEILVAIQTPNIWNIVEDYVIYFLEEIEGIEKNKALDLLTKVNLSQLILAEPNISISDSIKKGLDDSVMQYSKSDLAIIDWNSAVIYGNSGDNDIADVIEFCLTHLLEMRYYDDLLDKRLLALFDSIQQKEGILSNAYSNLANESSQKYIEFSEFLERVDNSLKTVGDFYLANVFRSASNRFRFDDWRKSIDRKMSNLAKVSELLSSETNLKRSHYLEVIVIVLILLEVLPNFWGVIKYLHK